VDRVEHPESLCGFYDLIVEEQVAGNICMLVCRPGSKPNSDQLKARGVVLSELLVNMAMNNEDVRAAIETGINCDTVRTFVI